MASSAVPNSAVPSLLAPGWLTADTSGPQSTGRVAVTADNTSGLPNPTVPTGDEQVTPGTAPGPGAVGEPWTPTTSFPWPAVPDSGDGIVAVVPGMTGNGNGNDDPVGWPGYDGPFMKYEGAYASAQEQGGLDAVAQLTDGYGFNQVRPGANMGYQRHETRLLGNTSPGYVNVWNKIWNAVPMVKTANQFTQQPLTSMTGDEIPLPAYADLGSLSNSGGPAYYVNGPEAPQVSEAAPAASPADPAAGWA
jgi:hypothetical protein